MPNRHQTIIWTIDPMMNEFTGVYIYMWQKHKNLYSVIKKKNNHWPFSRRLTQSLEILHWSQRQVSFDILIVVVRELMANTCNWIINPLCTKFFRGNISIDLHFVSFIHIDMTQVLKILPQVSEGPTYSILSISWLLMSWRCKEPGHQQPWYWPS